MLETIDWKKEKIGDYRALSAILAQIQTDINNDEELKALDNEIETIGKKAKAIIEGRTTTIAEAKEEQQMIKMELLDHWDIDENTYKCDAGSATLRTKKTLEINDQNALLIWLFKLERLESAIRTMDASYLKRLKDADMIPDALAVYDSKTTVVITEAKE